MSNFVDEIMGIVKQRDPNAPEFHQAVSEVVESLEPLIERNPIYRKHRVVERVIEPERVIMFRVPWLDDKGDIQVSKGFRVEYNSAIGPYKGGLRFHPSVNLSILKFLGFEQIFKNSLTTLPMGGGKGGSDFDPKGKSDNEVMKFCQSFMSELFRHIGPNTDVPAGDIGVGGREIGYMFGTWKKLRNEWSGVLTGKGLSYGGSLIRPQATGYGATYFLMNMLATKGMDLKGKVVAISGSGNVSQYATEKVTEFGGKVVTLSDSDGVILDEAGIDKEKLQYVMWLKNVKRGRIKEYAEKYGCKYIEGSENIWKASKYQVAMPCATQNELNEEDAKTLVANGCIAISEGANMPSTPGAVKVFIDANILYGLGKAANAGGVATSGLEMSQNSLHLSWPREEVDRHLQRIMKDIHDQAFTAAEEFGQRGNYVLGANIAGFRKVADAMIAQGCV
jgi:glutamate dehydrogenase (NADP+)